MKKTRVVSVLGARPNFMKMAPLLRELPRHEKFQGYLVHTGQHYDQAMSDVFFRDLKISKPDFNLNVGSGSHAVQTAETMKRFEQVCNSLQPDLVIVAGDVNSTLACSLTAAKLRIPVAHVESGLRSFDRTMPEEINRIVTDSVSDFLFTTEESANDNLRREGVAQEKIHYVGNTMIDSLVSCRRLLEGLDIKEPLASLQSSYFIATIHRPSNVDEPFHLARVLEILGSASEIAPLFFVTHPRTSDRLKQLESSHRMVELNGSVREICHGVVYILPPLPYLEFLWLMSRSTAVLTDSGGIQEESTFLGIPCLTLRENTERPVTVDLGTNQIVGLDQARISSGLTSIVKGGWKKATVPPLWDGRAAERIFQVLRKFYGAV
jgi:UDP-N-acetylglucosamine 2-epimerase (non-hydrolysing)